MNWFGVNKAEAIDQVIEVSPQHEDDGLMPVIKDLADMMPVILPICAMVFFTLTIKNEVEKQWIKIQAEFTALNKELANIQQALIETNNRVTLLDCEIDRAKQARHDILSQLSNIGIDLYVVGEQTDRRRHNIDDYSSFD